MSAHLYSEAVRTRMNNLYYLLRKHSQSAFLHAGLIHIWGVPKWVVKAFVEARFDGRDTIEACVAAHVGEDAVRRYGPDRDWLGWQMGRAWSGRLSEIEREHRRRQDVAA